jgi:hypothetical protein
MANEEHLKILKQGVKAWNEWRKENPDILPDLSGADLTRVDLKGADLQRADLRGVDLSANRTLYQIHFDAADLSGAIFDRVWISQCSFVDAKAPGASFIGAEVRRGEFVRTDFSGVNFQDCDFGWSGWSDPYVFAPDVWGPVVYHGVNLMGANLDIKVGFPTAYEGLQISFRDHLTLDGTTCLSKFGYPEKLATLLATEPYWTRDEFNHCFCLLMVEAGEMRMVERVPGLGSEVCTFETVDGDIFSVTRPPMSADLEATFKAKLREILDEENEG